jgi:hypothetical protein
MGNPSGVRRTQKQKRHKKEMKRLAVKAAAATKKTPAAK